MWNGNGEEKKKATVTATGHVRLRKSSARALRGWQKNRLYFRLSALNSKPLKAVDAASAVLLNEVDK